jgi:hypothetical protein
MEARFSSDVHADLESLAFLLGAWKGEGEGDWPNSGSFRYGEEMTFEHVGEPFLLYAQRSWDPDDGSPIHFERGFFRPAGPARVEVVLAHPLGVVEVADGTVSGNVIAVASTAVTNTARGTPVRELRRRIEVDGDALRYELSMATADVPLAYHVKGELVRA